MSKSKHPKKESKKAKSAIGIPGTAKPESKTHRVSRGAAVPQIKMIGRCTHELLWVKRCFHEGGSRMMLYCDVCARFEDD